MLLLFLGSVSIIGCNDTSNTKNDIDLIVSGSAKVDKYSLACADNVRFETMVDLRKVSKEDLDESEHLGERFQRCENKEIICYIFKNKRHFCKFK